MAARVGREGRFRIGANVVGNIDSWSVSRGIGTEDVTAYGDTWEAHDPTLRNWQVTFTGTLDTTHAQQLAMRDQLEDATLANINVVLQLTTAAAGARWDGSGIMMDDSIGSEVRGKVSYSGTVKGDGELSYLTT